MTNLILDPLNVFFLDILVFRKDIDVTHLLFGVISFNESQSYFSPSVASDSSPTCFPLLPPVSPIESSQKPLQVYCRRQKPPTETSTLPSNPTLDPASLPIALRKGKRSCTSHLSLSFSLMVTCLHLFMPLPHP